MLIQEDVQGDKIMEMTAVLTPDKEESECRVGCIRTVLQI